jgi:hypothetical protein
MDMVRHEAVGVQCAAFFADQPTKLMHEKRPVIVLMEAGSAIVAALNSVHRNACEHDPGTSRHLRSTTRRPWR